MTTQSFFAKGAQAILTAVTVFAVIFLFGARPFHVRASITTDTSASLIAPFNPSIKASSAANAFLGIDAVQGASETLTAIKLTLNGLTSFATTDLATLGTGASSGIALYKDNKSGGTTGSFDATDTVVTLASAPTLTQVAQF